jgi:hypothetical protein
MDDMSVFGQFSKDRPQIHLPALKPNIQGEAEPPSQS